jgi:hypothetical protein
LLILERNEAISAVSLWQAWLGFDGRFTSANFQRYFMFISTRVGFVEEVDRVLDRVIA